MLSETWNLTFVYARIYRRESFEPSQTSVQREHKLSRKSHLKVRQFSDCLDCVFSFELKNNIMLHDGQTPVLSCHVCIISYWRGQFEIQCKSLGHAHYVNNFSVQERLIRESVYLKHGSKCRFPNARKGNPPQILDLLWFVTIRYAFTVLLLYVRLWEQQDDTTCAHARGAWFRTLRCFSSGDRTVRTEFESAFMQNLSKNTT